MVPHFLFLNRAGGRMPASHPKHGGSREYMTSQNLMMILIYLPTMSRWAVIMRFGLGTSPITSRHSGGCNSLDAFRVHRETIGSSEYK